MPLTYALPVGARLPLIAIAAGMTLVIVVVAFAVVSDVMPVTSAVDYFIRRGFKRNWFVSKREHFHRIEENVYDFYKHRPAAFFTMFACDLLAHVTTAAEVFIILGMLGFEPSARVAYIIDSLTKVINLVFGFVPATIGVYEGGTGFILHTLGYAVATGVTIGIVRKASMIVWALLGLASLVSHTAPSAMRKVFQRHPRLREVMDNLVLSNMTHRPARTFVSILGVGVGVLLIAFTVGLAHGVLRERGRRESEVGAEIMVRASGTTGIGVTQRFTLPVSRADEIQKIEGVRIAAPIGQTTDASESGFGMRVIDGIQFERYAQLSGIHVTEGRGLQQGGDEAIVDSSWKEQHKVRIGDTVKVYGRDFRIVGVGAASSVLVILLAMYTTVTERTRQIGVLKSLGMSNASVAWVIEQEARIVSVLGVLFGIVLTLLARFVVMRTTSLTVDIEPRWLLISLLIGLVGGTVGALYPALRAARQDAVEALSYE